MKKIKVDPGICGLESIITAVSEDGAEVNVTVETKCKNVQAFFEAIEQPVDAFEVCFAKPGSGTVYEAGDQLAHGACPVPAALIKCIEAECSLALPANVTFEFVE